MKEFTFKFIFFILGAFFFFLSQIFLLVQGIKNYIFFNSSDREIIVEKTLFEQFSLEVYESINTPFSLYNLQDYCYYTDTLPVNLNMETYFDCSGISNSELKKECQKQVVSNYTDCSTDSYRDINFTTDQNFLNYEDRINFDPRTKYCDYFSNFTQKLYKIGNKYICNTESFIISYENLLANSFPLYDVFGMPNGCPSPKKNCGFLDTKNNILCLDFCPINNIEESKTYEGGQIFIANKSLELNTKDNKPVIISVILSENQPMSHEWSFYVKETYEDLDEEEKRKRRGITKKDFDSVVKGEDYTYKKIGIQLSVGEIYFSNTMKNFDFSKYNLYQNLDIYVRNYIGFKDIDELNDFKTFFNEKDPTDNPLYELTCIKYDPIITITFASIFIMIAIIHIIYLSITFKKEENNFNLRLIRAFFLIDVISLALELFIIAFHFIKYPKINIDMDERMKEVLDLYNERTFSFQIYRIISVTFSAVSIILIPFSRCSKDENNLMLN